MAHPLFGPEVRMMLLDKNRPSMKAFVETLNPMTVAETLSGDEFTVEEVWEVLGRPTRVNRPRSSSSSRIDFQVAMAEGRRPPADGPAHRVDVTRRPRRSVCARLPAQVQRLYSAWWMRPTAAISPPVAYGENTVGAIMTSDYAWLPAELTAQQAIDRLRVRLRTGRRSTTSTSSTSRRGECSGILTLRGLVLADPNTPIRQILLVNDLVSLKASDDREVAADALGVMALSRSR